jgi:hypothetical protein
MSTSTPARLFWRALRIWIWPEFMREAGFREAGRRSWTGPPLDMDARNRACEHIREPRGSKDRRVRDFPLALA